MSDRLEALQQNLSEIMQLVQAVAHKGYDHYWHTLDQAISTKFGSEDDGISRNTVKNTLALQPRGGIPDGWVSGRKVWTTETIIAWCKVDDCSLQIYLDATCPGRQVPKRIAQSLRRH